MSESDFWEQPEAVERFAGRDPDHRLATLAADYSEPARTRVLDVGCAGGRNTDYLAARGFDVYAIDASAAMVAHTRRRIAPHVGRGEAERRVIRGRMDDLSAFESSSFALVVALGVFHSAHTQAEWRAAISEAARVLAPAGQMLVAVFTPRSDPTGDGIRPVAGLPNVYDGLRSGRHYLVEAGALDAEMARHALAPTVETATVEVPTEHGCRVTVNALYRKHGGC